MVDFVLQTMVVVLALCVISVFSIEAYIHMNTRLNCEYQGGFR